MRWLCPSEFCLCRLTGRGGGGPWGPSCSGQWVSRPVRALRSPRASSLADPAMAGSGSASPRGKRVFTAILMFLAALVLLHSASSQSHRDFMPPGQQKREAPVDLLSQIGRSVRGTLDAWIGPETTHLVSEVRKVFPAVATRIEDRGAVVHGESPRFHRMKPDSPGLLHSHCFIPTPGPLAPPASLPYSCPFLPERLGNEPSLSTYVTGDYRVWLWSKSDLEA